MHAGFGARDITPKIGSWLNGFIARLTPGTAIDIQLTARALWLEDERTTCLIISLDILGLSTSFADQLTQTLASRLNLPESHIVISCTHNHSGPMTCRLRGIGPADEEYLRLLESQVYEVASAAAESKRPVEVSWGESPLEISLNRRQIDPLSGKSVLGFNPNGPTDRGVRVLHLRSDNVSTVLFTYACHPYCLGPEHSLISPDFPGHAVAMLEARGHQALFLNGCCGDLAPRRSCEGPDAARSEGEIIADAVLNACQNAKVDESPQLEADSIRFFLAQDDLPPFEVLESELKQSDSTVRPEDREDQRVLARIRAAWDEWLKDLRQVSEHGRRLPSVPTRVSLMRIGQGAIVALPGEPFYEIGQRIAAHIGANPVCVAAYCHGYIGYVPTREAYAQGGYEVDESHRYVSLWRIHPDTEEILTKHVDLLSASLSSN